MTTLEELIYEYLKINSPCTHNDIVRHIMDHGYRANSVAKVLHNLKQSGLTKVIPLMISIK